MIRALVGRNLRHQRALLAGLCTGLVAMEVFFVFIAGEFEKNGSFKQMYALVPPFLRNFIGFDLSTASVGTFIAFGYQHPAVITIVIAYTVFTGTIPAGDRDAETLDLILARPIPRGRYFASVLLTIGVGAVLLPACTFLGSALGIQLLPAPGHLPWSGYVGCAVGLTAFMLAIAGFALMLSTFARRRGTAIAQVVAVLVTLFLVDAMAQFSDAVAFLQPLSPFHYFQPLRWVLTPPMSWSGPVVLVAVAAACSGLAFARFQRRDV